MIREPPVRSESRSPRPTFKQILDATREKSAEAIWSRASLASNLRHIASRLGRKRESSILGGIKGRALAQLASVLPGEVRVGIDDNYQIGLVTVSWQGHGRFHLPANATTVYPFPKKEMVCIISKEPYRLPQ